MKTEVILTNKYVFYMDDFGTRTTCKGTTTIDSPAHEFSFALGGTIVAFADVAALSAKLEAFCDKWKVPSLHGNKIRSAKGKFGFLKKDPEKRGDFFSDLDDLVLDDRLIAHACVVCRPGYRDRYLNVYADASSRWDMSKTAFDISVERAAKFAMQEGRMLDVVYERTGAREDRLIDRYFADLKEVGLQFCEKSSGQYDPLTGKQFNEHLNIIWSDGKNNPLLQLADLVVHPVSHITCGKNNRAYNSLVNKKMLLDFKHKDENVGVKYYCYDGEYGAFKTQKESRRIP